MLDLTNLPLTAKLILDLEDFASKVEFVLADYLLPCPEGIYIKSMLEPVMVGGVTYYTKKTDKLGSTLKEVKDINNIKEAIYDKDSKIVIPKAFMLNKDKYISNQPILPYRGLKLIEVMLKAQLYSYLKYYKHHSNHLDKLQQHLLPIRKEKEMNDIIFKLDQMCAPLIRDLTLFMGVDDWHMYTIKLACRSVVVEKFIDYRIFTYTQKVEEGEWT